MLRHLLALSLGLSLAAQDAGEVLEGHSAHGQAFNEGPRQRAYLMEGMGSVQFEVQTTSEQAQAYFNQGVAQLHGFWYFEAERSFRQVAAIDPTCAMAYWGMAMANFDENEDRARSFSWEAWQRRDGASQREVAYVEAMARYFGMDHAAPVEPEEPEQPADAEPTADATDAAEDPEPKKLGDMKTRRRRFISDLEEIIFDYPEDIEAKAFLVNQMWLDERQGLTISSRQANQALLDQVFAANPNHPAHHYRIHLWDKKPTAKRVVESAVRSGPALPGVAHMWHMGGHIFAKLRRHADAAWQQEASARVDHAHMMRDAVLPDQIHNFAHNNEWLTRSLRNVGRVEAALDLARNMIELPRHPIHNTLEQPRGSASYGRRRLLETLEQFELWDELLETAKTLYVEPGETFDQRSQLAFYLGRAHFGRMDAGELGNQIAALRSIVGEVRSARSDAVATAEDEALDAAKSRDDVQKAVTKVFKEHASDVRTVRRRLLILEALREFSTGEHKAALAKLKKHNFDKLARARLLVMAEDLPGAEKLTQQVVDKDDGVALPLAQLAWIQHRAGDVEAALATFDELRAFSAGFDLELPVFTKLAPLAAAAKAPLDWRIDQAVADDVGSRPDLDTLGPFRWAPTPAAPWRLPNGFGEEIGLADYAGRPVLVVFFLGFGCVHCVEQLTELKPVAGRFAESGIEIVAIGTDSTEALVKSQQDDAEADQFPFPILADPSHDVFKLYRAFDDFEAMPLHGTFLVDGAGLVRWMDVSYEPFMDVEFLLRESRRLLGLDGQATRRRPPAPRSGR